MIKNLKIYKLLSIFYNNCKNFLKFFIGIESQKKTELIFSLDDLLINKKLTLKNISKLNHKKLHQYLINYNGVTLHYIKKLIECLKLNWMKNQNIDLQKMEIYNLTKEINSLSLPPSRWFSIYDLCFKNGFFEIMLLLRKKAIGSALKSARSSCNDIFCIESAYRAAIDQGNFLIAKTFLSELKKFLKEDEYNKYKYFYSIQSGKSDYLNFIKNYDLSKNKKNHQFRNLIEGKSIAIVGPAKNNEKIGKEIDEYDIIVRSNYRGNNPQIDKLEFGSRTDVSYYNSWDSNNINKYKNFSFFEDLKACAFKSFDYNFQINLLNSGIAHQIIRPKLLLNGGPLQGINIIYDILYYQPSKIKIFKNNLFLSKNSYFKSYRKEHLDTQGRSKGDIPNERLINFATHDLISHFNFFKNLTNNSNVFFDKDLNNILKMTTEEYINKIKEIYFTKINNN